MTEYLFARKDEFDADVAALAAHIADTVGAHAASAISFTPAAGIAATEVQAAIEELKADVDALVTAQALGIAGDSGTGSVDLDSQSLAVVTANNSLVTSAADQTVTISLADVLEDLDTLGPSTTDGEFLVATGVGTLAWESGATARASMSVYSIAEIDAFITAYASTNNAEGASLIGVEDAAGRFTGTDVEAALAECATDARLASTSNGLGAALIGIEDSGGLITASTVEGALAENRTAIDAIEADYLTSSDFADTSGVNTGTSTTTAVTPDALAGSNYGIAFVEIQCFRNDEVVVTGDDAASGYWRVPPALNGWNLVYVAGHHGSAGTTGSTTVQVHNLTDTADMLSSLLTISAGAVDSTTATINGSTDDVATGDRIRIDVDSVTTTPPQGLTVTLGFRVPT